MSEAGGDHEGELYTRAGANSRDLGMRVLDTVRPIVEHTYAQWLVEDPHTCAYRVVAARLPPGTSGYETAHRLGVIGQVFRTGRAVFAADTHAHPLYDAYDATVDWELAVPAFESGRLVAVLNLEGRRPAPALDAVWERLAHAVRATTGAELAPTPPRPGDACLKPTAWVHVEDLPEPRTPSFDLARLIAGAGQSALVVTAARAASAADLESALSGVAPGIDRLNASLPVGAASQPEAWRAKLAGRYDYVLLPASSR